MMISDIRKAAILILLPAMFAIGASPARAQSFTRTFELKGLEDGDFRIRVFVRQVGSSEGRVIPLTGARKEPDKNEGEKQEGEKQEGASKQ
ncbi:MAG: hypothetical protein AB7W16_24665 [Candidatus Obscuribacterales bacterium]